MHRSRLGSIVIDCKSDDLQSAAEFWSRALGCEVRVRDDVDTDRYVALATPGDDPCVTLQKVEHDSRVHLDIETDDFDAETARLVGLGATVIERLPRWVVFEAPTGHRFCVINQNRPRLQENGNVWGQ